MENIQKMMKSFGIRGINTQGTPSNTERPHPPTLTNPNGQPYYTPLENDRIVIINGQHLIVHDDVQLRRRNVECTSQQFANKSTTGKLTDLIFVRVVGYY